MVRAKMYLKFTFPVLFLVTLAWEKVSGGPTGSNP
jgi:hypothetical protein